MVFGPRDEPHDRPAVEPGGPEESPPVVASSPAGAGDAFDALFGDEVAPWPERAARRGLRVTWPAVTLAALLLVVGGMGLGAYLQRTRPPSTASFFSGLANITRSGSPPRSFTGKTPSAPAPATAGTVTDVKGNDLYVTTASGSLVTVVVGPSTTIDRDAASSLSALRLGDTVTVEGKKAANGDVEATSVAATAKGLSGGPVASGVPVG